MTYRVVLLALTSVALLAGASAGVAQQRDSDRLSLLAQAPRLADPPAPTEATSEEGAISPDSEPDPADSDVAQPTTSIPSEEIRTLQEKLGRLGYYQGAIDGVLGPETGEAISLFQRDVGLATTGLPDPLTLQQLQAAENPLGIVPEAPLTPSEAPEADTTAAPDGQNDVASTPVDGGPEAEESLEEEAAPNPSEADNPQSREGGSGLLLFLLSGMVVAALGISAAVAFLFLSRRPANDGDPDEEADSDLETEAVGIVNEPPASAPQAQQSISAPSPPINPVSPTVAPQAQPPLSAPPPPITPLTIADAPRNGHNPAQSIPPQTAAAQSAATPPPPPAQSAALAPETTTKLVPVNIIDELVQDLESPDPAQRRKAIWELGQRGNSAAVQPLVRLMLDADSKERSLILAALAEINTQALKPMNRALALSLQDENPEVRKNAIRDMTRIYDLMGQASTMLNHAAMDSDPEVRQTASWAMEQLDRMRLKAINTDVSSLPGHNGSEV